MRIAYADPPYLGCAAKLYGDPEYDRLSAHARLLEDLEAGYDAWAMSLHEPSIRPYSLLIAALGLEDVRWASWVKPFASFKPGVDPAYTWEPIVYRTARTWSREQDTVRDHVSENITLKKGLTGAKPRGFSFWLFELLGASPDDEFVDLFPGSGMVSKAWEEWRTRKRRAADEDMGSLSLALTPTEDQP